MSEGLPDKTIINPGGREVEVPGDLAEELLQQPGFREKGKKDTTPKEQAVSGVDTTVPENTSDPAKTAPLDQSTNDISAPKRRSAKK